MQHYTTKITKKRINKKITNYQKKLHLEEWCCLEKPAGFIITVGNRKKTLQTLTTDTPKKLLNLLSQQLSNNTSAARTVTKEEIL